MQSERGQSERGQSERSGQVGRALRQAILIFNLNHSLSLHPLNDAGDPVGRGAETCPGNLLTPK